MTMAMAITDDEIHRYARQLILPGMDEATQAKIKTGSVVVVGAGGIGIPLVLYLAAAGVGRITSIDGDTIEASNLNRQIAFRQGDIGKPKTAVLATRVARLNSACKFVAVEAWLDADNAEKFLTQPSIIVDATDQPATRSIINRVCHRAGVPLVFASAIRLEGQLASFASGIRPDSPCLACAFPDLASPELAESTPSPLSRCDEVGILGAVTGVLGSLAALEVLRQCIAPASIFGDSLIGKLLLFDGRDHYMRCIGIQKRADCPVCQHTKGG